MKGLKARFEFYIKRQGIEYSLIESYGCQINAGTKSAGSRIPIPSAIWLLGSGLVGLVEFRR
ncbi:MAG: hypothetical protein JRJ23_07575 [Deltaproteobacteria bacterium]|nr:hypothetical protein [Deltaproteobacteria bacterium]